MTDNATKAPAPRHAARPALALGLLLTAIITLPLVGCGGGSSVADDGRLTIVATTGMLADLARHVVGEHAEVVGLMGEGIDPHLYRPTRHDVLQLQAADVIVYNGLLLEGRMGDTLAGRRDAGQHVIALGELLDTSVLLSDEDDPGEPDPHIWMDVSLWSHAVELFADRMTEIDPAHADAYRANAERYQAELAELDDYVRQIIDSIPDDHRVLVTAHDAFNYFGRAYDIEVLGVYGLSTDSEAGTHDINRLVDMVVSRAVPAVFVESSVSDRPVAALIRGAESRGHAMRLGGELYSDAMGSADSYEGTYIGMLDHNATTIARALGGDAPERGLRSRLGGE